MWKLKVFLLFIILVTGSSGTSHDSGSLTVKITGIKSIAGKIKIGLFNSSNTFPRSGEEFRKAAVPVTKHSMAIIFKNLPAGEYAIAYYHDENEDGDLNRNFIGIPKEGYGFSNNIAPKLSVPSFEQTKIAFPEIHSIEIKTIY